MEVIDSTHLFTIFVFILMSLFIYLYLKLDAEDSSKADAYRSPMVKPVKASPPPHIVSHRKRPLDGDFPTLFPVKLQRKLEKSECKSLDSLKSLSFKVSRLDGSFEIDSYLNALRPTFYTDPVN